MDARDLLVDAFGRIKETMHLTLNGLTAEQLAWRPDEQSNSIAWLAWHLTRVQDDHVSDLAGQQQAWVADGWHARFDRPAEPDDTGFGYTAEQVAAIRPTEPRLLLDYYDAVHQRTVAYVDRLTAEDLDRELDEPRWNPRPTVGVRLVSVVMDDGQHLGQIAYVRGLLEGRHWFPA